MSTIRDNNGKWLDTSVFRKAGETFMKNGYYCPDPYGSPAWYEFWKEERRRCLKGYEVAGHKITGNYYFYLNYCPIQKVDILNATGRRADKIKGFPDFWDGDYNYFWIRDIARNGILEALHVVKEEQDRINALPDEERFPILREYYDTLGLFFDPLPDQLDGGLDLVLGKARRRGFSFKNASVAVCNFFHRPNSYTMLIAYEKKYLFPGKKTIFGKCKEYINFVNEHTAWKMPSDYINTQQHIRASYKETKDGVDIEKGFMSEIEAISFKDNPDAGRGADAYDIIGEEVGAWGTPGGLKNTIAAMRSSSEAGIFKTGMMTMFGTSGDMEGGTVDFADLFRRPKANGFMSFKDRWGKFKEKVEGFFFPKHMNTEGFYDENGNSDMESAKQAELLTRKILIDNGATSTEIQKRMQEEPLDSAEAFALVAANTFPVVELQAQLDKVIAMNLQAIKGTPVKLHYVDGKITATPILDGSAKPIISFKDIPLDIQGCPIIYEFPADPPAGLYKIGYDPIRQEHGTSLAGIIVYKGTQVGSYTHDIPVAEYVGRYDDPDDIDRVAEMFADLFNTKVMYENEVTGVKNYFRRIKRLSLLALQPDTVISKNIKKSKVARVYGCHMNEQLKDAGERYVKSWLLTVLDYDENDNPVRVIDRIYSIRLLEELISYFRKGNFDLVSALFMCMFQVQEEVLGKEYGEGEDTPKNRKYRQLMEMMETNFK
ncbi:MAG TPA: hypothetical protein PLG47_00295 [Candidatus Dojkabacteria bacterium]|nr:hypothetical protein [Candidatus Dojkabacteria bacterium]